MQGDTSLHNASNMRRRHNLRQHPAIVDSIQALWSVFDKNQRYEISKVQYVELLVRICKVLIPEFNESQARATADVSWHK